MRLEKTLLAVTGAALLALSAFGQEPSKPKPFAPVPPPPKPQTAQAAPGSTLVAEKDVPAAVTAAFAKLYPKAKMTSCAKQEQDGKPCFRVAAKEGFTTLSILYTADGTLLETRESVFPDALPPAVKKVVNGTCPKCAIVKCERVKKGASDFYAILLNTGKKGIKLTLDAQGKPVE